MGITKMMALSSTLVRLLCFASLAGAFQPFRTSFSLPELRELAARNANQRVGRRDVDSTNFLYREHNISVPIDHFHNDSSYEPHSDGMFNLRYWFDATYYKKGGPIIVLQSGETSGEDRLPFLQKGIVAQLSQATGGLGVILEHRYYGTSFPVSDLSTENLRFLTIDQAVKDMVYFAQHVVFEGMEDLDLTAPKNAYIAYGGSYAGAFVAILRKLYPDVYWGAISSSGVTEAIYDYWQYYEAARLYAPRDCVTTTQKLTHAIDNILIGKKTTDYVARLKKVMGFENVTRNDDFAYAISGGIAGLQGTNWDPAINSTDFGVYCDTISSDTLLYPGNERHRPEVQSLLTAGGYGSELDVLTNRMLNYIGYLNDTVLETCEGRTQDACFTNFNSTYYQQDDINQDWRSWPYQYCTQWGYLQTGSGVPSNILPLISRLIDLNFTSVVCREAFNITNAPDVAAINKYGGFGISYPRLAIIDGEHDPWRAATPHAIGLPNRKSTVSEPFILIEDAVHHWDENGLFPNETMPGLPPRPVADTQRAEAKFVKEWMKEWKQHCKNNGRYLS